MLAYINHAHICPGMRAYQEAALESEQEMAGSSQQQLEDEQDELVKLTECLLATNMFSLFRILPIRFPLM